MRLAVTYDLLPLEAIQTIVGLARDKGALVYVDDAGGARVGPSLLVSRGCRSSVSISVRRAWTNTAHRARASACSPARAGDRGDRVAQGPQRTIRAGFCPLPGSAALVFQPLAVDPKAASRPALISQEECRRCGDTRQAAPSGSRRRLRSGSVLEGADNRNSRPSIAQIGLRSWRATPALHSLDADRPGLKGRPSSSPPIQARARWIGRSSSAGRWQTRGEHRTACSLRKPTNHSRFA
jgi:hypothetical protein